MPPLEKLEQNGFVRSSFAQQILSKSNHQFRAKFYWFGVDFAFGEGNSFSRHGFKMICRGCEKELAQLQMHEWFVCRKEEKCTSGSASPSGFSLSERIAVSPLSQETYTK